MGLGRPIEEDDINPHKKMKLTEHQQTPESENDANASNLEDYMKYIIIVNHGVNNPFRLSDEVVMSIYSKMVEDAGCSGSQIYLHSSMSFFATLTKEQFKKLSAMENVFKSEANAEDGSYALSA